jgi:hypothetical protein
VPRSNISACPSGCTEAIAQLAADSVITNQPLPSARQLILCTRARISRPAPHARGPASVACRRPLPEAQRESATLPHSTAPRISRASADTPAPGYSPGLMGWLLSKHRKRPQARRVRIGKKPVDQQGCPVAKRGKAGYREPGGRRRQNVQLAIGNFLQEQPFCICEGRQLWVR